MRPVLTPHPTVAAILEHGRVRFPATGPLSVVVPILDGLAIPPAFTPDHRVGGRKKALEDVALDGVDRQPKKLRGLAGRQKDQRLRGGLTGRAHARQYTPSPVVQERGAGTRCPLKCIDIGADFTEAALPAGQWCTPRLNETAGRCSTAPNRLHAVGDSDNPAATARSESGRPAASAARRLTASRPRSSRTNSR